MEYYEFPDKKVGIFQPNERNYFIEAGKFSYLCTYEEMMRIDRYRDFQGAFVMVIYKRYALIEAGRITWKNDTFNDGHQASGRHKENGFVIMSDIPQRYFIQSWNDYLLSYQVRDDKQYNKALNPIIYKTAEDAVRAAAGLSKENSCKYMVVQWFDECDRH